MIVKVATEFPIEIPFTDTVSLGSIKTEALAEFHLWIYRHGWWRCGKAPLVTYLPESRRIRVTGQVLVPDGTPALVEEI